MKYDIFISYKRMSLPTANNLYYRLTTKGYSTFFDLEEMRRDNFDTQLLQYIENANDANAIRKIEFFQKYGIVKQINENLYAYQYELPQE